MGNYDCVPFTVKHEEWTPEHCSRITTVASTHHEITDERPKRSYVRKAQARELLINAAIDLFRERPFSQVTTKEIADRAGLTPVAIQSTFGGQLGLYEVVAQTLIDNVGVAFAELGGAQANLGIIFHPDLTLSTRLVAWLRGEGVVVNAFTPLGEDNIPVNTIRAMSDRDLDPTLERVYGLLIGYAVTGFATFAGANTFPVEDVALAVGLIRQFRQFLADNQEQLRSLDQRIQPRG